VYGVIDYNISDKLNYNISGQVTNVNNLSSLQRITINVTYLNGRQEQLIGYKAAGSELFSPLAKGQIVTDIVSDMPYAGAGGLSWGCNWTDNGSCGTYTGYYHVVTTSRLAKISGTWNFSFVNEIYGAWNDVYTWGAPYIGIYNGTPGWVNLDADGNVEENGVIFRGGLASGGGGCMPGCSCATADSYAAPISMEPTSCTATCVGVWDNWNYEKLTYDCLAWWLWGQAVEAGDYQFTATTTTAQPAGTYTVLFFNGEDRLSLQTRSASVTYTY
jgi:hypothetical protein